MKNNKGFTLIELLVVISIIGMMSSVVLASLNTARDKAKLAAGQKFDTSTFRAFAGENAMGVWKFNEAVGSATFVDDSGNGKNLTGSVTVTNGIRGNGLSFSGNVANYLVVDTFTGDTSTNVTVSAWINYTEANKNQSGWIASLGVNTNWNMFLSGGQLRWRTIGVANDIGCNLPKGDTWHHVLITQTGATGSTKTQMYIDGALCNSVTSMPQAAWGNSWVSVGRYQSNGSAGGGSTGFPFNGRIDELYLYNRYLLASEVQEIYAAGAKELGIAVNK